MLNFKNLILISFLIYFVYSLYTFYEMFKIQVCNTPSSNGESWKCLKSLSHHIDKFQVLIYMTQNKKFKRSLSTPLYQNVQYINETITKELPFFNTTFIKDSKGDIYTHTFILPFGEDIDRSQNVYNFQSKINKYMDPQSLAFNLVKNKTSLASENKHMVNHILTDIVVHVVDESRPIKINQFPKELGNLLKINSNREYLPILYMSKVDCLQKRYKPVTDVLDNRTAMPSITVQPISLGKLRLFLTLEQSIKSMKKLGFTDKDTDEIKSLFVDTNLYLLLLTFVISFFHMMFDVLAFKNDISFWKNRDSMAGISSKTAMWRCFSQAIVFLYLCDEKTSLLVLIPTGIGVLIEAWKVTKALKYQIILGGPRLIQFRKLDLGKDEIATQAYDDQAVKYLSYYLIYPLCFAGAIYSLIYLPHKSWYSWIINSLVNGVYAFGFIFMLPQLIINYKLKSVAHLPWRAFMYKAFNTFIDDVFAFIITMPTTHRLACFRDDLIFLCYLYQRWLYPVDKRRVNEFGQTFDDSKPISKQSLKAGDHMKAE